MSDFSPQTAEQTQTSAENSFGGGGNSAAPPVFQLKTEGDPADQVCMPEEGGPDVHEIADKVWYAMFGGTGWGTDEQAIMDQLAKLDNNAEYIEAFIQAYTGKYGSDIVTDLSSELSDGGWWGNQLSEALGYLNATHGYGECEVPEEPSGPQFDIDDDKANGRDQVLESAKDVSDRETGAHLDEGGDINCSLFVKASLNEGDETEDAMEAHYIDPGSGLKVGYKDANPGSASATKITLVKNHMVVNLQPEATEAILKAQKGDLDTIAPGTDEHTALVTAYGAEDVPNESFLLLDSDYGSQNFVGMAAGDDLEFGAGAAAISMGGKEIEQVDRRPGDLQQTAAKNGAGNFVGTGHSSIIWEVKGEGVGFWKPDCANCPVPDGWEPAAEGWYEGPWIINGDTNPYYVAKFTVGQVKLIDANIAGAAKEGGGARGSDATQIGDFSKFNNGASNRAISNGRLPDSKWIDWAPWEQPLSEDPQSVQPAPETAD